MSKLIKVVGAVVAGAGAITGIVMSTKSYVTGGGTNSAENSSSATSVTSQEGTQEKNNQKTPKDPKNGYYVLASWEDGTEWTVSAKNFFGEDIYSNNGLGFDKVDMKLGNQKLDKDHRFYSPINGKGNLLVKYNTKNAHYKLEDGKEQLSGHLRINWDKLSVKKYSDKGFSKWTKGRNTLDYDLEFNKCNFKKNRQDTRDKELITVTCKWGQRAHKTITRELSSEDFRY